MRHPFITALLLALPACSCSGTALSTAETTVHNIEGCDVADATAIIHATERLVSDVTIEATGGDREAAALDAIVQLTTLKSTYAHCKATATAGAK